MEQAGVAEGLVGRLRDAAALAGDQRVGDGAGLARQRRDDAPADRLAHALDGGAHAQRKRRASARFAIDLGRRRRIADGAEPLEPGRAREVVVARQRRARRRAQRRPQAHRIAGRESRLSASGAHAHARPATRARSALHGGHAQGEALAARWRAARPARRSRTPRPARSGAPAPARARPPCAAWPPPRRSAIASSAPVSSRAMPPRPATRQRGERGNGRQHRRPASGLDRQQEVERDAGAEQHRQPQEPALLLGLEAAGDRAKERQCRRIAREYAARSQRRRSGSPHLRHRPPRRSDQPPRPSPFASDQHAERLPGKLSPHNALACLNIWASPPARFCFTGSRQGRPRALPNPRSGTPIDDAARRPHPPHAVPLRPPGERRTARRAPAAGAALPHADPRLFAADHAQPALRQLAAGPVRQLPGARGGAGRDAGAHRHRRPRRRHGAPSTRSTSSSRRAPPTGRSPTSRVLAGELEPYLEPLPGEPAARRLPRRHRARGPSRPIDFIIDLNRKLSGDIAYRVRMEPGVQTPQRDAGRAARAPAATPAGCWCRSCAGSASRRASCRAT